MIIRDNKVGEDVNVREINSSDIKEIDFEHLMESHEPYTFFVYYLTLKGYF